jgi:hypothetical protein
MFSQHHGCPDLPKICPFLGMSLDTLSFNEISGAGPYTPTPNSLLFVPSGFIHRWSAAYTYIMRLLPITAISPHFVPGGPFPDTSKNGYTNYWNGYLSPGSLPTGRAGWKKPSRPSSPHPCFAYLVSSQGFSVKPISLCTIIVSATRDYDSIMLPMIAFQPCSFSHKMFSNPDLYVAPLCRGGSSPGIEWIYRGGRFYGNFSICR